MSKASPWGIAPQSFTGTESYAYSYSSQSYSSHSYSSHSYSGASASPMLSVGISNARSELVIGLIPPEIGTVGDVGAAGWVRPTAPNDGLPNMNDAEAIRHWAPDVRDDLAVFELVSRLAFSCPSGQHSDGATLYHLEISPPAVASDTSAMVVRPIVRMSRPPREVFEAQLKLVESWASSRETRGPEILTQLTPPMGYFASIANLHSERTPKTLRLIGLAQHFAYLVGMQFKHALACPRPVNYTAFIQPMIETPGHASLPAGHAVESFMAAGVIEALVPGFTKGTGPSKAVRRLAHRIGQNRVIAGLHFPIDCIAGQLLGDVLAQYFVALCQPAGKAWTPSIFDGASLGAAQGGQDYLADLEPTFQLGCRPANPAVSVSTGNPILCELWKGAAGEWPSV